ncbi:hypothetical protein PAXRUDRAFT_157847, partial [Paxillus rubicundulus Ve08.2h10]
VTRVKISMEPLTITANILQGGCTRLVITALCLENLYHIYGDVKMDSEISTAVHASLEKHWVKANQGVFICTVMLNPFLCTSCFSSGVS